MFCRTLSLAPGFVTVNGQAQYVALQTVPPACEDHGRETRTCYTLYSKSDSQGVRWQEAFDYCRSVGGQLAIVSKNDTQRMLGYLVANRYTGNGHAWIAARRDTGSNAWKNVIGGIFQGVLSAACVYVGVCACACNQNVYLYVQFNTENA